MVMSAKFSAEIFQLITAQNLGKPSYVRVAAATKNQSRYKEVAYEIAQIISLQRKLYVTKER